MPTACTRDAWGPQHMEELGLTGTGKLQLLWPIFGYRLVYRSVIRLGCPSATEPPTSGFLSQPVLFIRSRGLCT